MNLVQFKILNQEEQTQVKGMTVFNTEQVNTKKSQLASKIASNNNKLEGHKVYPDGQDKWSVIRSIMQNYHKTDKNVIFDKNRGWTTHIEFVEKVTGKSKRAEAKIAGITPA